MAAATQNTLATTQNTIATTQSHLATVESLTFNQAIQHPISMLWSTVLPTIEQHSPAKQNVFVLAASTPKMASEKLAFPLCVLAIS